MHPGLRVIRLGEWQYNEQDGGECHVGTVCLPEKITKDTLPKGMVFIAWDTGIIANYWFDCDDTSMFFDLRVFDNGQTGTRHVFVTCDVCGKSGVIGIRWHCTQCHDYDLCNECYMSDKHDLSHVFVRYDTPMSVGVQVPPRETSHKKEVKGIFVGARVTRGPDWSWGNQDGGVNSEGMVSDISGRDDSWRSVLDVQWESGHTNRYRLGLDGKVDVRAVSVASAGQFYCDHLPKLCNYAPSPTELQVGDLVKIDIDANTLEQLQKENDNWDPDCLQFIGKIGSVVTMRKDAGVNVYFNACKKMIAFNYKALTKVPKIKRGDMVHISNDKDLVKQLQVDHGGWVESMSATLGRKGKVVRVFDTGDLRVVVRGSGTWTFNSACCSAVTAESSTSLDDVTSSSDDDGDETVELSLPVEGLQSMGNQWLRRLLEREDGRSSGDMKAIDPENLLHQAERGEIFVVSQLVRDHPEKVNEPVNGRLPLHAAAGKGHTEVVRILLEGGAEVNAVDSDGDTALHFCVYGDRVETLQLLIRAGASINAQNHKHHTALQIAVVKPSPRCVAVLLEYEGCDVNLQDDDGDTVLHDAIFRGNHDVVEMLLKCPRIDFSLRNKKSFTVLHQAAFKGNVRSIHRLLECEPVQKMVDLGTTDGHTALHVAAVNGFREVAQALVDHGRADVNALNRHRHTPLMLALSEGRSAIIEFLVSKGADVTLADVNGVTSLHMALCEHTSVDMSSFPKLRKSSPKELDQAPAIAKICLDLPSDLSDRSWIGIACFLVEHGASLTSTDMRGNTPVSTVKNPVVIEILQKYASLAKAKECIMCMETEAVMLFQPCGHQVICYECSVRMKKCFLCHEIITSKINQRLESSGSASPDGACAIQPGDTELKSPLEWPSQTSTIPPTNSSSVDRDALSVLCTSFDGLVAGNQPMSTAQVTHPLQGGTVADAGFRRRSQSQDARRASVDSSDLLRKRSDDSCCTS